MKDHGPIEDYRGQDVVEFNGEWFFCDTGESVRGTWMNTPCGHCSRIRTTEGYDRCLGTLDGVRNACCGHGQIEKAYVQFWDKTQLDGNDAILFFKSRGRKTNGEN